MYVKIAIALTALGFATMIWTLVNGGVMKAVIAVFNAIAGKQWVPTPSLASTAGFTFVALIIDFGLYLAAVATCVVLAAMEVPVGPFAALLLLGLIPVSFLLKTGILSRVLSVDFGRALAVFFTQRFVVNTSIAAVGITFVLLVAVAKNS